MRPAHALIAMADGDGRYLLNMIEQLHALPHPSTRPHSPPPCRNGPHCTTSRRRATTTSSPHSTSRCEVPTPTRPCTGWRECSTVAKTPSSSRAASPDSRPRTSAWPTRNAVQQALAAWDVYERLGSPEGELAIAQAVIYLATAPKSIGVYRGFNKARAAAKRTGSLMPPAHILNARPDS